MELLGILLCLTSTLTLQDSFGRTTGFEIIDKGRGGCKVVQSFSCWSSSGISVSGVDTDTCDKSNTQDGDYLQGMIHCCTGEATVDIDCLVRFKARLCITEPWVTIHPMNVFFDRPPAIEKWNRYKPRPYDGVQTFQRNGDAILTNSTDSVGGYEISCGSTEVKRKSRGVDEGLIVGVAVGSTLTIAIVVAVVIVCVFRRRRAREQAELGLSSGRDTQDHRGQPLESNQPSSTDRPSHATEIPRPSTRPSVTHPLSPRHHNTRDSPTDNPSQIYGDTSLFESGLRGYDTAIRQSPPQNFTRSTDVPTPQPRRSVMTQSTSYGNRRDENPYQSTRQPDQSEQGVPAVEVSDRGGGQGHTHWHPQADSEKVSKPDYQPAAKQRLQNYETVVKYDSHTPIDGLSRGRRSRTTLI